jgi:hypothetical protein
VPFVVVDFHVVVVMPCSLSVDGEADTDGGSGGVEVMPKVGFSSESSDRQGAGFEGRIPANPPVVASNDARLQRKFVGDDHAEAGAVGHLPGEVKPAPAGVPGQVEVDHGPPMARDVKATHRHMTGCTKVDVDHGLMVPFQVKPHGRSIEVGQRVACDVVHVGKGGLWSIDDDREQVWRTGGEVCFTRFNHRMKGDTNGRGLRFVWTHPRPWR